MRDSYDASDDGDLRGDAAPARGNAAHYLMPFGAPLAIPLQDGFRRSGIYLLSPQQSERSLSYRKIAWEMNVRVEKLEPELGRLMEATIPGVEWDPLKR